MTKMNKKEGRRRKLSKETEKDTELEKEENTSAESEEVEEAADTAENATEDTEKKAEESETEKLKKSLPRLMTSISDLWLNMITSGKEAQRKDWSLQTQQRKCDKRLPAGV